MTDDLKSKQIPENSPQCQFFVQRKKRLCRMTVRPGRSYCGEHEPAPTKEDGEADKRVPCPLDPKHTCYASKLAKHLNICNAKEVEAPPYICRDINRGPAAEEDLPRRPLHEIPKETLVAVIEKVNLLYQKVLLEGISQWRDDEIHNTLLEEWAQAGDRAKRHLKQVSSLLHILLSEGLMEDDTCYVELGAGKGQLSYYVAAASGPQSSVLLVERAAMRHTRDRRLAAPAARLRADLAHLRLERAPLARPRLLHLAKHLCGSATDLALRCICNEVKNEGRSRGIVLATCCHHRCTTRDYVASHLLQEHGVNREELQIMLSIVSWATCGDGYSREVRRNVQQMNATSKVQANLQSTANKQTKRKFEEDEPSDFVDQDTKSGRNHVDNVENVAATKCQSIEDNISEDSRIILDTVDSKENGNDESRDNSISRSAEDVYSKDTRLKKETDLKATTDNVDNMNSHKEEMIIPKLELYGDVGREEIGRRAKAVLDWGRILYLRTFGFDARLAYYVPTSVSLENVCIIAKK